MAIDRDKVEEITLALLHLTTFKQGGVCRAWKGHAWEVLASLQELFLVVFGDLALSFPQRQGQWVTLWPLHRAPRARGPG